MIWPQSWGNIISNVSNLELFKNEWQEALAGMTAQQIKTGIEYSRTRHKWPPTIAEFIEACHEGANLEQRAFHHRLKEGNKAMLALPSETWEEQRERGRQRIAEIRAILDAQKQPQP